MGTSSVLRGIMRCADGNDRYGRKPEHSPGSPEAALDEAAEEDDAAPEASSIIRLQNGMVLYLREINKSEAPCFG